MNRLHRIQENLNCDLWIIEKPVDLFYLTGLEMSKGRLVIGKKEAFLFVDGRYFEMAKKKAPCKVILSELNTIQKELKSFHTIGIDSAATSLDAYQTLQKLLPEKKWEFLSEPLKPYRLIKDAEEIGKLKRAADVTWRGYKHAESCLKVGVTEEAIAWEFERFCREHGASELSFSSIIAFGENSAYPHHRAGKTKLENDQVVMIDVGAVVDHYAGDLTRMVFFGKPDPQIEKMFHSVKKAQQDAMRAVRVGMEIGELDRIARKEFQEQGTEKLFVHGLGHGIGLEAHEYPRIKFDGADAGCILEEGMVFTIEPGLYLPGLGGVRYEDMVVVTKRGGESLYPLC